MKQRDKEIQFTHYITFETRYHGPGNYHAARVSARRIGDDFRPGESIRLYWDHELDSVGNHNRAALALAEKLGYTLLPQAGRARHGYLYLAEWRDR